LLHAEPNPDRSAPMTAANHAQRCQNEKVN